MKKTTKFSFERILALILTLTLILTAIPLTALPAAAASGEDFEYDVLSEADKTCRITKYTGSAASLAIPTQIDGYSVACLGYGSFSYTAVKSVTVPNTVTDIAYCAFVDCTSLTDIELPSSVKSIGSHAFEGCKSLTSITIPDSVTGIDDWAFKGCTSLTSAAIGNGVTEISYETFRDCTSLVNITIPDRVTSISEMAFYNTAYYNNEANWENGVLYIGNHLIKAKKNISGDYQIKQGTKTIADWAFDGCASLTSVAIPNSVVSIGYGAFRDCTSLESITIGNSVTSISGSAFRGCTSLESVTIPSSVTTIGDESFEGCTALESVTVPESVAEIGSRAFYNTAYYNNEANWENGVFYIANHLIKAKDNIKGDYQIKQGTKTIADYAFSWCSSLTSVTIPDSVTSIDGWAFKNCTSLTSITIPNSVTYIGGSAFRDCTSLTSVTIPSSVESISVSAFEGCTSLTSITIPSGVTSIDYWAFYNCTSLTNITIPDSVTSIGDDAFSNTAYYNNEANWENGVLYIGNHLIKAKSDTVSGSYQIKQGTKIIADSAFYKCTSLISVTIPDSVTSIGGNAFKNCTDLTSVTIPDSVTSIGNVAFGYFYNSETYDREKISGFTIYGCAGSEAERYANENGFTFISNMPVSGAALTAKANVTSANVGEVVTVSVDLSADSELGSLTAAITYNPDEFEYISGSAKYGSLFDSSSCGNDVGEVKFAGVSFSSVTDAGTVFTAQFKVLKTNSSFGIRVDEAYNVYDEDVTSELNGNSKGVTIAAGSGAPAAESKAALTAKTDVASANIGDIITVSVDLNANADLSSLQFSLVYDPEEFAYIDGSVETYGLFASSGCGSSTGEVSFAGAAASAVNSAGTVLTAQFKVLITNCSFGIRVDEAYNGSDENVTAAVNTNSKGVTVAAGPFTPNPPAPPTPVDPSVASLTVKTDVPAAKAGDVITVSVDLSANSDLGALLFYLTYNPDEFEYVAGSAKVNGLFENEEINDENSGEILCLGASSGSVNAAGTLLIAQFKVLKPCSSFGIRVDEAIASDWDDITSAVNANSKGATVALYTDAALTAKTDAALAKPGDIITVSVDLSANSDLGCLDFSLIYNPDEFEYVAGSAKDNGLFGLDEVNDKNNGEISYVGVTNTTINKAGTLLTAQFKVLKANSSFGIRVDEAYNGNDDDVTYAVNANSKGATVALYTDAALTAKTDVASAKAGDIITVLVDLNANSDLGSLQFYLTYNPDEFEYVAESAEGCSVFGMESVYGGVAGEISYVGVTNTTINKAGTLLTAQFKVLKTNSSFDIRVYEAYNGSDGNVTFGVNANSAGTTVACKHTGGSWTVVKEATCTENGSKKGICVDCGAEVTEAIPAKGHSFGSWVVTKAATCTEAGVETRTCTACGKTETQPIPAKGHSLTLHKGFAATCEAAGEKDYYVCSVCGKYFEDEAAAKEITKLDEWKVIPATGHNWVVSADGTKRTCTVCGAVDILVIPGDVNGDGKVSAVDARWALQCAAQKRVLSEKEIKAADMNGDGKITAIDARQILKKAAGK